MFFHQCEWEEYRFYNALIMLTSIFNICVFLSIILHTWQFLIHNFTCDKHMYKQFNFFVSFSFVCVLFFFSLFQLIQMYFPLQICPGVNLLLDGHEDMGVTSQRRHPGGPGGCPSGGVATGVPVARSRPMSVWGCQTVRNTVRPISFVSYTC